MTDRSTTHTLARLSRDRSGRRPSGGRGPAGSGPWQVCQTNPIPGRGDLGIDHGLWIIDDLGWETPKAAVRQTKPISPVVCLRLPKRHPERTPHGVTTSASNKANSGRGGLGMDYGLRTIDDVGWEISRAAVRQTKPIGHSEIPPLRPSASGRNDRKERPSASGRNDRKKAPGPPAPNKANCPGVAISTL